MQAMGRRNFLGLTAAGIALAAGRAAAVDYAPLKKGLQYSHLPEALSDPEKFAMAKRLGFDGIEIPPIEDLDRAKALGEAARAAGTPVHSVIYGGWGAPMSDPRPVTVAKGKEEIRSAMQTAKAAGADTVLLVPAVVNDRVGYGEAWERSQENIRELAPQAEDLGIVIAVENVWNKFLLSPLEFARYVDDFESPNIRAYFDIGNVVIFGYPEDWIRTLGKRIHRIHVKDFKRQGYEWCKLPYEGDVNWREVRKAINEVGYTGWATEEFPGGGEEYLAELSRRMTLFNKGARKA